MSAGPKVSILMPVYNGRDYLRPALDSLLAQTFQDFEIVIVNDGSTDDTLAIIESYKDPRIVAVTQVNQGVARSLNNGLKVARGKYIRRHDADDTSTPDALQVQFDFMESHPDFVMVTSKCAFMTSNGKIAYDFKLPNDKYFGDAPFRELSLDDFTADRVAPAVHGTACFRRQEILDIGGYRPEFIVSEDNDLWMRLLEKYRIAILNHSSYFIRIHGQSATARHRKKIQHFRDLLMEFSKQRRESGTDPIMRGETVSPPPPEDAPNNEPSSFPKGKKVRGDLEYMYSLVLNAKDYQLSRKYGGEILSDGWRVPHTWKMLLFPLLGDRFIKSGVAVKSLFRSKST
ncbi:MAG: glycosyltransferase family A protein [bacterium]